MFVSSRLIVATVVLASLASAWNCDDSDPEITPSSPDNTISDGLGNYESGYNTFSNLCTFRANGNGQTSFGEVAQLTLTLYKVEEGFDKLEIFDGTSAGGSLIDVDSLLDDFSEGDTSYTSITICSNSPDMFIRFTSDSGITEEGFSGTVEWSSSTTDCLTDFTYVADGGSSSGGFDPTFIIVILFVAVWIGASVYQASSGTTDFKSRIGANTSLRERTRTRRTEHTYDASHNEDLGYYFDGDSGHNSGYGESDFGGNLDEDYSYMLEDMGGPAKAAKRYKSGGDAWENYDADQELGADDGGMDIYAISATPTTTDDDADRYYDPDKTVFL